MGNKHPHELGDYNDFAGEASRSRSWSFHGSGRRKSAVTGLRDASETVPVPEMRERSSSLSETSRPKANRRPVLRVQPNTKHGGDIVGIVGSGGRNTGRRRHHGVDDYEDRIVKEEDGSQSNPIIWEHSLSRPKVKGPRPGDKDDVDGRIWIRNEHFFDNSSRMGTPSAAKKTFDAHLSKTEEKKHPSNKDNYRVFASEGKMPVGINMKDSNVNTSRNENPECRKALFIDLSNQGSNANFKADSSASDQVIHNLDSSPKRYEKSVKSPSQQSSVQPTERQSRDKGTAIDRVSDTPYVNDRVANRPRSRDSVDSADLGISRRAPVTTGEVLSLGDPIVSRIGQGKHQKSEQTLSNSCIVSAAVSTSSYKSSSCTFERSSNHVNSEEDNFRRNRLNNDNQHIGVESRKSHLPRPFSLGPERTAASMTHIDSSKSRHLTKSSEWPSSSSDRKVKTVDRSSIVLEMGANLVYPSHGGANKKALKRHSLDLSRVSTDGRSVGDSWLDEVLDKRNQPIREEGPSPNPRYRKVKDSPVGRFHRRQTSEPVTIASTKLLSPAEKNGSPDSISTDSQRLTLYECHAPLSFAGPPTPSPDYLSLASSTITTTDSGYNTGNSGFSYDQHPSSITTSSRSSHKNGVTTSISKECDKPRPISSEGIIPTSHSTSETSAGTKTVNTVISGSRPMGKSSSENGVRKAECEITANDGDDIQVRGISARCHSSSNNETHQEVQSTTQNLANDANRDLLIGHWKQANVWTEGRERREKATHPLNVKQDKSDGELAGCQAIGSKSELMISGFTPCTKNTNNLTKDYSNIHNTSDLEKGISGSPDKASVFNSAMSSRSPMDSIPLRLADVRITSRGDLRTSGREVDNTCSDSDESKSRGVMRGEEERGEERREERLGHPHGTDIGFGGGGALISENNQRTTDVSKLNAQRDCDKGISTSVTDKWQSDQDQRSSTSTFNTAAAIYGFPQSQPVGDNITKDAYKYNVSDRASLISSRRMGHELATITERYSVEITNPGYETDSLERDTSVSQLRQVSKSLYGQGKLTSTGPWSYGNSNNGHDVSAKATGITEAPTHFPTSSVNVLRNETNLNKELSASEGSIGDISRRRGAAFQYKDLSLSENSLLDTFEEWTVPGQFEPSEGFAEKVSSIHFQGERSLSQADCSYPLDVAKSYSAGGFLSPIDNLQQLPFGSPDASPEHERRANHDHDSSGSLEMFDVSHHIDWNDEVVDPLDRIPKGDQRPRSNSGTFIELGAARTRAKIAMGMTSARLRRSYASPVKESYATPSSSLHPNPPSSSSPSYGVQEMHAQVNKGHETHDGDGGGGINPLKNSAGTESVTPSAALGQVVLPPDTPRSSSVDTISPAHRLLVARALQSEHGGVSSSRNYPPSPLSSPHSSSQNSSGVRHTQNITVGLPSSSLSNHTESSQSNTASGGIQQPKSIDISDSAHSQQARRCANYQHSRSLDIEPVSNTHDIISNEGYHHNEREQPPLLPSQRMKHSISMDIPQPRYFQNSYSTPVSYHRQFSMEDCPDDGNAQLPLEFGLTRSMNVARQRLSLDSCQRYNRNMSMSNPIDFPPYRTYGHAPFYPQDDRHFIQPYYHHHPDDLPMSPSQEISHKMLSSSLPVHHQPHPSLMKSLHAPMSRASISLAPLPEEIYRSDRGQSPLSSSVPTSTGIPTQRYHVVPNYKYPPALLVNANHQKQTFWHSQHPQYPVHPQYQRLHPNLSRHHRSSSIACISTAQHNRFVPRPSLHLQRQWASQTLHDPATTSSGPGGGAQFSGEWMPPGRERYPVDFGGTSRWMIPDGVGLHPSDRAWSYSVTSLFDEGQALGYQDADPRPLPMDGE